MPKELNVKEIERKKAILVNAGKELKSHFVGIDDIIDIVINHITTWFLMPELLTRPTIVCLWGSTGVGKTDLVRKLVKLLSFQDKFCEVSISNKGCSSYPWAGSMGAILRNRSNIQSGNPAVLLLDEMQGFRTIDEDGHDIHDCKFKDVWTLLSDGKLPYHVEMESLMNMLWDLQKKDVLKEEGTRTISHRTISRHARHIPINNTDISLGGEGDEDEDDDEEMGLENAQPSAPRFDDGDKNSFYELSYFKSLLRLDDPIEEIALWTDAKRKSIIIQRLTDKTIFEEEDYTKCLIFISGNLDEAYGFTEETKEVDSDADMLHEMSKGISILDIKQALTKRFKPEQISRMGNSYVIYPSLSRSSFETIINRKVETIKERVLKQTGITLEVDKTMHELIYNNGVFPAQGTRPVFSTISDILENSLPDFLLNAILKSASTVRLQYGKDAIEAYYNGSKSTRDYIGSIDKLKSARRKNMDSRTLTAVHEAGHAVSFAILFGMSPSQIVATAASNDAEGFVHTIRVCNSREMARKRLCVMLAGQAAEKIVFGKDNVTSGSGSDLSKATEKAALMVRKWGMESFSSAISRQEVDLANNNQEGSNNIIEEVIKDCKNHSEYTLLQHLSLLEDTVDTLLTVDKITPVEFRNICARHGVIIAEPKSSEDIIYWKYHEGYIDFKKSRKRT